MGHLRLVSVLCAAGSVGVLLLALDEARLLLPATTIGYGADRGWSSRVRKSTADEPGFSRTNSDWLVLR